MMDQLSPATSNHPTHSPSESAALVPSDRSAEARTGRFVSHQAMCSTNPLKPTSLRGPLLIGVMAVTLGFGGFAAFAAMIPVATAVVAPGIVALETDRKKLQHLEGGIVRELRVREGQTVAAGEILFRLEPLQAEVAAGVIDNQIMGAIALEARLLAERDGASRMLFPSSPKEGSRALTDRVRSDQERQFAERRASVQGQVSILETRIRQSDDQISGLRREREASELQLRIIESELVDLRRLYELRLVARPRLLTLEREQARLSGAVGQADAGIARVRNAIEESRREITQVRQAFTEKVAEDLRLTRERLAELREKARAAGDVLARLEIRAPRAGTVQGLKVSTIGEVVQPGAVLLEIASNDDALLVSARVRPQDADGLSPGMEATLRFTALPSRTTPVARGSLVSVSRDRLVDPATDEPYFLARVRLIAGSLPQDLVSRVSAGMPAEVIVPTQERTLAGYLLRPLADAFARSFRER